MQGPCIAHLLEFRLRSPISALYALRSPRSLPYFPSLFLSRSLFSLYLNSSIFLIFPDPPTITQPLPNSHQPSATKPVSVVNRSNHMSNTRSTNIKPWSLSPSIDRSPGSFIPHNVNTQRRFHHQSPQLLGLLTSTLNT
ncbi:hypothetical protein PGTUg99_036398 [Puccinia graminis f. sp. tritici]|uniref:Uncharacterized protein n=1 Tax=Puccinia graminis f. sp. tritici TaxID=56615 RepID=A0A5B0MJD4_PUCGR|nr:hypothetical protein PGTUg99_036398 [Puccinia graminis f. sp. tritici]